MEDAQLRSGYWRDQLPRCPACGATAPYLGLYADFSTSPRRVWFACTTCTHRAATDRGPGPDAGDEAAVESCGDVAPNVVP